MVSGGNVLPIRRCWNCDSAGSRRELTFRDEPVTDFNACDVCVAKVESKLTRARPVFDAMILAGVPRETANDAMTFLLERWTP